MDLPTFQRKSIEVLKKIIPTDWTSYNEFAPARVFMVLDPELPDPNSVQVFAAHIEDHPVIAHVGETGEHGAWRLSDFLSLNRWRSTGLYNEFFVPLGLTRQMSCFFRSGPAEIAFAINRDQQDFSDEELAMFKLIAPHLELAYRRADVFTRVQRALEHVALVEVDSSGRIGFCTDNGRSLLDGYFPQAAGSFLPGELRGWLRESIATRRDESSIGCLRPLIRERAGRRLVVRLSSSLGEDRHQLLLEEKLDSSLAGAAVGFAPWRRAGLTQRECEVLRWLVEGKRNSEIAIILGISAGTVKLHVERILVKLGVETRTAAAQNARHLLS